MTAAAYTQYFCDGCGKLRSQIGRVRKSINGITQWFCPECTADKRLNPSKTRLFTPQESAGRHRAHNNSTPRLKGSLGQNKPMEGAPYIPANVKITRVPTPPDRFAPPASFVGAFSKLPIGKYLDEATTEPLLDYTVTVTKRPRWG